MATYWYETMASGDTITFGNWNDMSNELHIAQAGGLSGSYMGHSGNTAKHFLQSNITQVGIIGNGTWQGTAINDTYIGTIDNANKVSLTSLNIDGGTDIGAALTTSDLIIVDDGGGGTNRKSALSRMTTFMQSQLAGTFYPSSIGYGHSSNTDIHFPSSQLTNWLDSVYAQSGAAGPSWSGASDFWNHSGNSDIHFPSSQLAGWLSTLYAPSGTTGQWQSQAGGIYYQNEVVIGPSGTDYGSYNLQVSGSAYFSGGVQFIGELSGLADPTYNSGAANKHYVDTQIQASSSGWNAYVYPENVEVTTDGSNRIWLSGQGTTVVYSSNHIIVISSQVGSAGNLSDLTIDADKNWNSKGIWSLTFISSNLISGGSYNLYGLTSTLAGTYQPSSETHYGWNTVSNGGTISHSCSSRPIWVTISPSGTSPIAFSFTVSDTQITVYHTSPDSETFSWRAIV